METDWSECPEIEINQLKQHGAPVFRGTRAPVDAVLLNLKSGSSVADVADDFEVPIERIRAVLDYLERPVKLPALQR